MFRQDCTCPALLKDLQRRFPYGAVTRSGPPFQTVLVLNITATGLVRFRSPLLAESRLMSFPPATEMFQFAGFASRPYEFSPGYPLRGGLPHSEIQGSTSRSHLPLAYRSVPRPSSPLSAKASTRCPYSTLDRKTRRLQGQAPQTDQVSHEDTLSEAASAEQLLASSRATRSQANVRSPRRNAVSASLPLHPVKDQSPARSHAQGKSAFPDRSPRLPGSDPQPRIRSRAKSCRCADTHVLARAVVEVNGIEPMTSCLQSRRSPN